MINRIKNSLFWRISLVFLGILIFLALAYIIIAVGSANRYYQETTQQLNSAVAAQMLEEVNPFVDGEVNEEALGQLMHSMMAVNPNLEIYLLDPDGEILSYVVLKKKVKLSYVDMVPIHLFLAAEGELFIKGDDPKNPGRKKIFSASEVKEEGELLGYVYMILASEEHDNVTAALWDSYILRVGVNSFIVTLVAAFIIGLLLVWFLTRNLRKIISIFKRFENGDLKARIPIKSNDELAHLSHTFNHMADTILTNIEELKKVDTLRKELIANVSHDLRNPLSLIHGYLETLMLKDQTLTDQERQKYMNIVLNNTTKLKHLVAELFELSKLEAKQVQPNKEPFSISELLQDISVKYQLNARQKNIQIEADLENQNFIVFADLAMMERVIQNLLENAIKYTPENEKIRIHLEEKASQLQISITNTGVGIPENELPHIFDRYYKTSDSLDQNSGTGLGLAIVKNILELHNSFIAVNSKIKQFTTFYFQLPLHKEKVSLP
ncbi:MAG: ATP-binding protein [Candidatus Cyclobacteriaceae bacterium M3_2C_046]